MLSVNFHAQSLEWSIELNQLTQRTLLLYLPQILAFFATLLSRGLSTGLSWTKLFTTENKPQRLRRPSCCAAT